MSQIFAEMHAKLCAFTKECRPSMHEPDEQGISARVVGNYLDNAFGDRVSGRAVVEGFQELVVVLSNEETGERHTINLASLIALARAADPSRIDEA